MPAPELSSSERQRSSELKQTVLDAIRKSDDQAIAFAEFMKFALYDPAGGYYCAASEVIGEQGDFVTAPELGSVFGNSIASKIYQCLRTIDGPKNIYEFGAGNGTLARQVLRWLSAAGCEIERYCIIEVSPRMRQRQQQAVDSLSAALAGKVTWLAKLPTAGFNGIVIANEVLDAMPVELFLAEPERVRQAYVVEHESELKVEFLEQLQADFAASFQALDLSDIPYPYCSELHCQAQAWMRTVASRMQQGSVLISDYGFPQSQYYHRDRSAGTLMCHRHHHASTDPLMSIGCQDITAHVNFSVVADVACEAGMELNGFTSLAAFLFDIGEIPNDLDATATTHQRQSSEMNKLMSPSEMGEIFKVMELTKNFDSTIAGFDTADRSFSLS